MNNNETRGKNTITVTKDDAEYCCNKHLTFFIEITVFYVYSEK